MLLGALFALVGCSGGGNDLSVQVLGCSYQKVDPDAGTFGGANARLILRNSATTTRVAEVVISNDMTGGAELIWYFEVQPGEQEDFILVEGLDCDDLDGLSIRAAGSSSGNAAESATSPLPLSASDPMGFEICMEFVSVREFQNDVLKSGERNQLPMFQAVTSLDERLGPLSTQASTPSIQASFRYVAGTWLLDLRDLESACNESGVAIPPLYGAR